MTTEERRAADILRDDLFYRNENGLWFFKVPGRDQYILIDSWNQSRMELLFGEKETPDARP